MDDILGSASILRVLAAVISFLIAMDNAAYC
jgi:hypothetical protein